jgi:hypothetical protein
VELTSALVIKARTHRLALEFVIATHTTPVDRDYPRRSSVALQGGVAFVKAPQEIPMSQIRVLSIVS